MIQAINYTITSEFTKPLLVFLVRMLVCFGLKLMNFSEMPLKLLRDIKEIAHPKI